MKRFYIKKKGVVMRTNTLMKFSVFFVSILMAAGCGGSSSSKNKGSTTQIGYLLDSGVSGVNYSGDQGSQGITGSGGSFEYQAGEVLTFTIGDGNMTLGQSTGLPSVTPLQLANATSLS